MTSRFSVFVIFLFLYAFLLFCLYIFIDKNNLEVKLLHCIFEKSNYCSKRYIYQDLYRPSILVKSGFFTLNFEYLISLLWESSSEVQKGVEHCSQKEMDRIDHGRSIQDKSTALVTISVERVIFPTFTHGPNGMNASSFP